VVELLGTLPRVRGRAGAVDPQLLMARARSDSGMKASTFFFPAP